MVNVGSVQRGAGQRGSAFFSIRPAPSASAVICLHAYDVFSSSTTLGGPQVPCGKVLKDFGLRQMRLAAEDIDTRPYGTQTEENAQGLMEAVDEAELWLQPDILISGAMTYRYQER